MPDDVTPPPGSDMDNFMKGTRSPIMRSGPCMVMCVIVFPDENGGYGSPVLPDGCLNDDWEVSLACEDSVDAAGLLDQLVKNHPDRAL